MNKLTLSILISLILLPINTLADDFDDITLQIMDADAIAQGVNNINFSLPKAKKKESLAPYDPTIDLPLSERSEIAQEPLTEHPDPTATSIYEEPNNLPSELSSTPPETATFSNKTNF